MPPFLASFNLILADHEQDFARLLIVGGILLVLVIVGFVIVSYLRRQVLEQSEDQAGGFSLAQLRQMHRDGKLSDAEFEKSKAILVATIKAATEKAAQRRAAAKKNK